VIAPTSELLAVRPAWLRHAPVQTSALLKPLVVCLVVEAVTRGGCMVTAERFVRSEVNCCEQSRAIEQRVGLVSRWTLLDCSQGQFHSHQRAPSPVWSSSWSSWSHRCP